MADDHRDTSDTSSSEHSGLDDGERSRSGASAESPTVRSDGGSAAGADETTLDPWGSSTVANYRDLFEEFGIERRLVGPRCASAVGTDCG